MIGQAKRLYELNHIANLKSGNEEAGKLYAFSSGKGGVGKTFVSLNIAAALADKGKKVLVIDLDFNLSNINVLLNSVSQNQLHGYFAFDKQITDLIYKYKTNLHFIFGDSGAVDYPDITETMLYRLICDIKTKLAGNYDFIFFDLAPGANKNIITVLSLVDEIVLLTTPEPTSVMDSYVIAKLLKVNEIGKNINVIVNKAGVAQGKTAFQNLSEAVSHFLGSKVNYLGNITFDKEIMTSIIEQKPYYEYFPKGKSIAELSMLAEKLIKINHLVNNSQP